PPFQPESVKRRRGTHPPLLDNGSALRVTRLTPPIVSLAPHRVHPSAAPFGISPETISPGAPLVRPASSATTPELATPPWLQPIPRSPKPAPAGNATPPV